MRRLWHALWITPLALLLFLGFLWLRSGRDLRYTLRVLWHRDASTDDLHWKQWSRLDPPSPQAWREAPDCARVSAAFATEPGIGDMDRWLDRGGALALVVVRDGAIACEWYGNGGRKDTPAMAFSISKTVTSLLLARAVAAHSIASLDAPITRYVPELAARDPRFSAITLAHLVDMRSGLAFDEETHFPWVDGDAPHVYYASDLAHTALERSRIVDPPGPFRYNDYAPNLLGVALERATGHRTPAEPMLALWRDLHAEYPVAWLVDDHGFAWHESGLVITARDLARIGQATLETGSSAAPAAWIARSRDPEGRAPVITFDGTQVGYRNGWWQLGDDALVAMGRHGQVMVVSPATHTVIVRLGRDGHDETNISIARRLRDIAARL